MKMYNPLSARYFLLILLGFVICTTTYSQKSTRPINGPRSEKNESDELGRRQGVWKYYYVNGDLREEIAYVNNLQEGLNTKYYKGKKTYIESNFLGGRRDGEYKRYFLSGTVAAEGKYIYGKRDGRWVEYYEDGQTKSERGYVKGVRDGNWKSYNRKGDVLKDVTFKMGVDVNAAPPPPKVPADSKKTPDKKKNYKVTDGTTPKKSAPKVK